MSHGLPQKTGIEAEDGAPVSASGEEGRRHLSADPQVVLELRGINEKLDVLISMIGQAIG